MLDVLFKLLLCHLLQVYFLFFYCADIAPPFLGVSRLLPLLMAVSLDVPFFLTIETLSGKFAPAFSVRTSHLTDFHGFYLVVALLTFQP